MAGPSGATAKLALPYPIPNDNVDVPRDIKALADKLEQVIIPVVTALPGSPVDGQHVYWMPTITGAATTPVWHMVYVAAQSKWFCVGGNDAYTAVAPGTYNYNPGASTVGKADPQDKYGGGAGTSMAIPAQGQYLFRATPHQVRAGSAVANVANTVSLGIANNYNTGVVFLGRTSVNIFGPNDAVVMSHEQIVTGLATNDVVGLIVQAGTVAGGWVFNETSSMLRLAMRPLYCG